MSELFIFHPPRRRGILFHSILILVLGATSAITFLYGMNQRIGAYFVLLLIISLLLFAPIPWIIYRLYSLARATYRLERDGLRLRWGLRAEDIPLPDVEWVRQASDLATHLSLPPLSWPGAITGSVNVRDLGPVEYLAATSDTLLLIATPYRVYAISPEDPELFIRAFQQTLEMGSLTPLSSVSVLPAAYLTQVWNNLTARILLIAGFLINLLLFVGVSLLIPGRATASLGFYPDGSPLPAGPAAQMILLPILGTFFYLVDLAAGLFFFRRQSSRYIGYLVWGSSIAASLLFLFSSLMILVVTR